jgi:hypothetical protein
VSTAAVVVAVDDGLVNTARNEVPLSAVDAVAEYVVDVAPARSTQVAPPSVDCCHWTVGTGLPEAAAESVNGWPTAAEVGVGSEVTTGPAAGAALSSSENDTFVADR